jgi:predicted cobalt transporter CbtA
MSATDTMVIGIVWALMSLVSVFASSQRNWKGGLLWLLVGVGFIAPLAY